MITGSRKRTRRKAWHPLDASRVIPVAENGPQLRGLQLIVQTMGAVLWQIASITTYRLPRGGRSRDGETPPS